MKTPDLTKAQLLATAKAAVAVAVAFGLPLSTHQQIAVLALAGALGTVLMSADAMIRRGRAQHLAGPITDQAAATAIRDAATASRSTSTADRIVTEAAAEQAAQEANDAQPADGVDPATL